MSNKKYQRDYYKKNRKRILAQRKKRYETDESYRKKALDRSRVQLALTSIQDRYKIPTVEINGKEIRLYSLPQMSNVMHRHRDVVAGWRNIGVIPSTKHKNKYGHLLYRECQVEYLAEMVRRIDHDDLNITLRQMKTVLQKVWYETFDNNLLTKILKEASV